MLADLCQARDFAMMMAGATLKITLVSIHQPLAEVPGAITQEAVLRMIGITGQALRDDFGVVQPRLAVAGLNPHAGEGGMFGDEEQRVIGPAVEAGRAGWLVEGPFPPDTVFKAVAGQFDAVVCMYHDQGLIPFKLLHFSDGVNVTLGLPIVRTSVDHGTAYDIAARGWLTQRVWLPPFPWPRSLWPQKKLKAVGYGKNVTGWKERIAHRLKVSIPARPQVELLAEVLRQWG
jgi:4-hydroxythreonine-4-phosphate dehydrogenase